MEEKETIEKYVKLGLEKGHSLNSLRQALLDQGIDEELVDGVLGPYYRKEKLKRVSSHIEQNNFINKIKTAFNKHPYLYILLIYFVLSIYLTKPLLFQLNSGIVGFGGGDPLQSVWNFWWIPHSLFTLHKSFYYTDYLFYPIGTSLAYHSLSVANVLISLPIRILTNLKITYNFMIFASFFLSAFSMFLLAEYLTKNRAAAFVAGLVYGFCPYRYMHSVHINLLSMQYLPLAILFLLKLYKKPNKKYAILTALFLFLNALSCWYYMQIFFFFFAIFIIYVLATNRKWSNLKIKLKYFGLMLLIFSIAISPFIYPMIKENLTTNYLKMHQYTWALEGADLKTFFTPSVYHPFWENYVSDEYERLFFSNEPQWMILEKINYVGFAVFLISIYAIIFVRFKYKILWLISAIFFFILTMGRYLRIDHQKIITLPYYFFKYLPFVNSSRFPARFYVMLILLLAVIFCFGFSSLMKKLKNKSIIYSSLGFVLISFVVIFEFLSLPINIHNPEYPEEYNVIKEDQGDFAIIELPFILSWKDPISMYRQTIHNKKIVDGYIARENPASRVFFNGNNTVITFFRNPTENTEPPKTEDIQEIQNLKFKYITVFKKEMGDGVDMLRSFLDGNFQLVDETEDMLIYKVY